MADEPPTPEALTVPAPGPLHLQATVRLLQRRPTNPIDDWDRNRWRRLVDLGNALALVEVENAGTLERPQLRWRVLAQEGRPQREALLARIIALLGLDKDPSPLARLPDVFPAARNLVADLRGLRPPRFGALFEAVTAVVPFQQLSLEAGISVLRRIVTDFGPTLLHDNRPWRAPPRAQAMAEASVSRLRGCGLSAVKAECLRHSAREVLDGSLSFEAIQRMPTIEASARLRELPGIGPWSAHLILLRGFGRLDAFPPGDIGVARGLSRLLGVALQPKDCDALGAQLPGAGGWLYFLSLAAQLLQRGLIEPAARA